jgi:colanic acid biosynthesis glycosyl transferase WcaI
MSRRIRFISQYFMPEAGATSELLSGIASELSRLGFSVDAIAGQPTYHGASRLPRIISDQNVAVLRVWSTQWEKDSTVGRIVNTISFAVSACIAALATPRKTILLAVTNPPVNLWICWLCNRLRGVAYVLIIHDVYPDIAVKLGALTARSPVAAVWRTLNRWSYARAQRIVVLGRDMRKIILRDLPEIMQAKVVIIANWADGRQVYPVPREKHEMIRALKIEDRFIVQYSGNIGRFHEIDTVLGAAAELKGDGFFFLFIGTGAQACQVKKMIRNSGSGHIALLPFQPREMLGATLTACDVGLVTLQAGLSGLAVPSKLYGILAAGKPIIVIGPEDCEAARVVRDNRCGMVVPPGDAGALATVLRELKQDSELKERLGAAARKAFERSFDLTIVSRQWMDLLSSVGEELDQRIERSRR